MDDTHALMDMSDDELLRRLLDVLRDSRRVEASLIAHIAEVDRRRLYLREAAPSMFAYCTEVLHLSEAEAYLRIAVARASREHPVLLAMLADGRLHLSGVAKLAPHLTADNRDAVLERAVHRSKRRIEELIAEIAPRPDAPSVLRRLPDRGRPNVVSQASDEPVRDGLAATAFTVAGGRELRPDGVAVAGGEGGVSAMRVQAGAPSPAATSAASGDRLRPAAFIQTLASSGSMQPLAPARYRVQFTASSELRDKIERLRALLLSSIPDGELGAIIAHAVSETLERLEARRFAKRRAQRALAVGAPDPPHSGAKASVTCGKSVSPRRPSSTAPAGSARISPVPGPFRGIPAVSRHVPASIQRAVYERDVGQCAYVDRAGRRCSARGRLEFHHRHPYGMGGDHSLDNVGLLCRGHNFHLAEHDYGSGNMAECRTTASRNRQRSAGGRQVVPSGPG